MSMPTQFALDEAAGFCPLGWQVPKKRVLIVEDDPDVQWSLARMLTVQGHRVVGTSSSAGALTLVTRWPVDVVLIDETLPRSQGIELAEHLCRDRLASRLVLMMDALRGDVVARVRAIGAACVLKPVTAESLAPWLGNASAAARKPASPATVEV